MKVSKGLEQSIGFLEIAPYGETKIRIARAGIASDPPAPNYPKSYSHYQFEKGKGEKVLKLLEFALEQYENHYTKPFIWGGVSPLTLEEQPNDAFQADYPRYSTQPRGSWRQGLPMEPGFDCIGFLRWIYGSNGSEMFKGKKKTANEYMQDMKAAPFDYDLPRILREAMPGDILFKCKKETGNAVHGMMYLGDGRIMECAGNKKPDYKNIPEEEWQKWRKLTGGKQNSEKAPVADIDRGGIQISHISKYIDYKIAIATPDILK